MELKKINNGKSKLVKILGCRCGCMGLPYCACSKGYMSKFA